MFFTIYKITNLINNKIYIGKHQTSNLDDGYMGSGKHLRYAIKKYGIENFKKEILFCFDNEHSMNVKEQELVTREFCLREDTYNLCIGGKGGFSYINQNGKNLYGMNGKTPNVVDNLNRGRLTQQYKKENDPDWYKRKLAQLSSKQTKYIELHGNPFKGKHHSTETKNAIGINSSIHQSGSGNSQYGKRWIHSIENKISIKILKTDPLPNGWLEGRKIKFE